MYNSSGSCDVRPDIKYFLVFSCIIPPLSWRLNCRVPITTKYKQKICKYMFVKVNEENKKDEKINRIYLKRIDNTQFWRIYI